MGVYPLRRGPVVILLLLLLAASAYGAMRALDEGWRRVTGFGPAHWQAERLTAGPAPLANRLVLIMVDGLRPDDANLLPSLDWLGRHGATLRLTVPGPNYQVPVSATLLTGALPQSHGVLLPTPTAPLLADTLTAAAVRAHLSTGGAGMAEVGRLLGPSGGAWRDLKPSDDLQEAARPLLAPSGPQLVLLHLDQLYRGAREWRPQSPEAPTYKELLGELDAQIVLLLEQIDLRTTAVMVVGLVPTGPNGVHRPYESVPLVMGGAGIREGYWGEASLLDIAPTAAALLGAPTPQQSQGAPLVDSIQQEGRGLGVITQRYLAARKANADATLLALGQAVEALTPPEEATQAGAYVAALEQQLTDARFVYWKSSLVERLPYLGGAVLVMLLYLIIALRGTYGGAIFAGIVTHAGLFHLILFASGGRYSAEMARLDSPPRTLATTFGLMTVAAMAGAALITGYLLSRKGFKKGSYLTAASLQMALCTALALALPVTVAVLFVGWEFPMELPDPGLLIWFFLTALQVIIIGALGLLWAAIAVSACRVSQKWWPVKESGDPVRNADNVVRLRALRRHVKN